MVEFAVVPPVFHNGILHLFPNEKIYIEGEEIDGEITNLHSVKENTNANRTLVFKFTQEQPGKAILNVMNPFSQNLKHRAHIQILGSQGAFKTSSCPVYSGMNTSEFWSDSIVQLAITGLRFTKERPTMCVY